MADKTLPTLTTAAAIDGTTSFLARITGQTEDQQVKGVSILDYISDTILVTADQIADAGAAGKSLLRAATTAAVQNIIGIPGVITFTVFAESTAPSVGVKGYVSVPYGMIINGWDIFADVSGDIKIDVFKDTYANFPPVTADSIVGTEFPILTGAMKNQDNSLSTWTTTVAAGDVLGFSVVSATTLTRATLVIKGNRT